ncbi:MAG: prohibitin family protein [Methanogenium sp.]|jgi:regulator of protease activity HflC (stomatin/prohibitin superfamily)
MPKENKVILGVIIAIVAFILLAIFAPFKIINAGNKGLVFNMGALQERVLDQGFHWRLPIFQNVKSVSVRPKQLDYQILIDANGAITKDNQTIGVETTTFYQYQPERLVEMWKSYGEDNIKSLVSSAVRESMKEEIGKYTIFDVAENQEKIRGSVYENLKKKLSQYPIALTEFRVSNYDWSDGFEEAIQTTMEKTQQVKQAQQELNIQEQQAQKQVKEAEAAKQAAVTKAEGQRDAAKLEAEAKALQGEGIKKYNESIQTNLDTQVKLLQLEIERIKAEKWNGQYVPSQVFTPIPLDLKGTIQK